MNQPFKILFVCTDNICRSLLSEYILRDYLKRNSVQNIEVSSAGTDASSDISKFSLAHFGELKKMEIDASSHVRTQITQDIVSNADLIIVFDKTHQDYLKKHFGINAPLFNKIYKNEDSEIIIANFSGNADERIIQCADYIRDAIPTLFDKIKRDYL